MDDVIRKAGKERRVLRIRYTDKKGVASIRNVEPYEIRGDRLWAYCRKRKGIRQFDMNKIENPKMTHHTFLAKYPVKFDEGLKKTASIRMRLNEHWFGPYEDAPLL